MAQIVQVVRPAAVGQETGVASLSEISSSGRVERSVTDLTTTRDIDRAEIER